MLTSAAILNQVSIRIVFFYVMPQSGNRVFQDLNIFDVKCELDLNSKLVWNKSSISSFSGISIGMVYLLCLFWSIYLSGIIKK